ncbi:MAG: c-type cytochrome [Pseudomonadota bacterium]|nr:c-type cytochrome [Pseudomonadota bacterium]
MKKISVYLILAFFTQRAFAENIEMSIIVENCKACHSMNYSPNNYIPSIKNLSKQDFISRMSEFKESNKKNVMERISKVFTDEDINKMADYIYD